MNRPTKPVKSDDRNAQNAVQKKELRHEKCRLREALPDQVRHKKSEEIRKHLTDCTAYRQADFILVYASYKEEVETYLLMEQALLDRKRVFCPRVEGKQLLFYEIGKVGDLMPGFRGIPEPDGTSACFLPEMTKEICKENKTAVLILIPGTVFDKYGGRIGYGGGYYDRFLAEWKEPYRPYCIGLAYDCQLTQYVPVDAFDICMDAVITEQGMEIFTASGKLEYPAL